MFVVFGGTAKVGTGWGIPDSTGTSEIPFAGKDGTTRGLLVGVGDGAGLFVGEGVKEGTSGCDSIGGTAVSSKVASGVFVDGSSLVGSLVSGILVEVSVGTTATRCFTWCSTNPTAH